MEELDFKRPKKIVGKLISVDVLDKIRAEICSHMSIPFEQFNQHDESDYDKGLARALFIIDKYKAESEE